MNPADLRILQNEAAWENFQDHSIDRGAAEVSIARVIWSYSWYVSLFIWEATAREKTRTIIRDHLATMMQL